MFRLTQPLHSAAVTMTNKLATVFGTREVTWGELRIRTAKLAGAIQGLGVGVGDPVGILALNSDRYLEYTLGCWWAGAVIVPMNTRWSARENAYSLNDSGARVLFVDDAFVEMLPSIQAEIEEPLTLIYIGERETPQGMLSYDALQEAGDPVKDANRGGTDLAGICYTGGTTGFPKGVMLSQQALWYNGIAAALHFRIDPGHRYMHVAPMFHLADCAGSMGTTMSGATHHFIRSFTPDAVIQQFAAEDITHTLMVPTMIGMVLQDAEFRPECFESLQTLVYGASPMPEGLLLQLMEQLPHVDLIQGYGQTEMAPLVTVLPAAYHTIEGPNKGKLRSAGRVVCGCELEIRDENGDKLPNNEVGEIYARSPGSMTGYLNMPERTAETVCDGWVRTGDGAYLDDDGFVFIVDRVKDMIVTGGENVFSAEVESVISTHPDVIAVAVVGIPHQKWGEAVHAIVVTAAVEIPSEQQIIEHCEKRIAKFKCPKSVSFRTEPLPLSGAGKVLKRKLRAPFWEGQERSVN